MDGVHGIPQRDIPSASKASKEILDPKREPRGWGAGPHPKGIGTLGQPGRISHVEGSAVAVVSCGTARHCTGAGKSTAAMAERLPGLAAHPLVAAGTVRGTGPGPHVPGPGTSAEPWGSMSKVPFFSTSLTGHPGKGFFATHGRTDTRDGPRDACIVW